MKPLGNGKRRQKEDSEIRKIIELIRNNNWSTYKYSKNEPSSMKSYVKVRAGLGVREWFAIQKD